MNKKVMTTAIALALGLAWTAAPALAQQTTTEKIKDKAETTTEKVKDKAVEMKDKVKDTAETAKDKVQDTARDIKDKVKDKVGSKDKADSTMDRAADKGESKMDRVKDKAVEVKDKVKTKMHRMEAKAEKAEVTAMQRALMEKGHDPGPVDGVMGPRTRAALRDYQQKEGLNATGRWDNETAAKLGVRMSDAKQDTMSPSASPSMPSTPATPEDAKRDAP